ncbi:cardiolipin synthase [Metabacillus fastidiosus]|uniref:Cardiolipin synthase n=1 Tax=Metabacillus fastidiosus TaxID=1458 RepID=A0ABU6P3B4_9BACI|nr:cardiolipin synthase [Metabacillus fastidiosus]MED4403844.1 cardiolipin synthase [Metabacillus fastidiosus]MED4456064.1 cardiolipin synthase [Metabacillus fastidiosus]MED4464388.1 cardiolipin synthase [Metabacillus fastidiosus]
MITVAIICFFFAAIIVWLTIDYKAGRKKHLQQERYQFYPMRRSNLEFYIDGHSFYNELFRAIKQSKQSVHILFYIVKNDEISHEFLTLLGEKAKQGVEVRLLLDYIGGKEFTDKEISLLKRKGVHFAYANKPKWPFYFYTLQARNHRKITVIDGEIGFLGGFNIGKEYLGHDPKLGFWRDYHLRLTNEGVTDLQQQFSKDWFKATSEDLTSNQTYFPKLLPGKLEQRFLSTNGSFLKKYFISLIQSAKKEILICTPYFIPGKKIQQELIKAAKRGVNVKVLVPMKADHPLVREASFPYYGPLILAGCEIYRFYHGFYHSKVFVVDDNTCDIGTANFDKRSFYINDEMNCLIYDVDFIQRVKESVYEDFTRSEKLTYEFLKKRPISERGKELLASMISYFL